MNSDNSASVIAALERDRADLIKALTATVEVAATYAPTERVAVKGRIDNARALLSRLEKDRT